MFIWEWDKENVRVPLSDKDLSEIRNATSWVKTFQIAKSKHRQDVHDSRYTKTICIHCFYSWFHCYVHTRIFRHDSTLITWRIASQYVYKRVAKITESSAVGSETVREKSGWQGKLSTKGHKCNEAGIPTNAFYQEIIKGTERASPIYTYSICNSSRVIFNTTDLKGD